MIRVVLFDIDGTLVHTGGAGTKAFAHTFSHVFGLHHGSEKMKFAGRTDVSLVREFFKIHGVPESRENFQQFFDNYPFLLAHVLERSEGKACAGAADLIDQLLELPEPPAIGLLTGNIQLGAEIKLRHFDLWEMFAFGGFADDHEERNHIAVAALQRGRRLIDANLQPQEVVVIGDTPFDVKCGKFIGAKTLAVATGGSKFEELKTCGADWTVEDLTKISARDICGK